MNGIEAVILGIIMGTLAAIIYALRVLVLMERRIARIDSHIEALVLKILDQEEKILKEEEKIERMIKKPSSATKSKKTTTKAKSKKKSTKKTSSKKK